MRDSVVLDWTACFVLVPEKDPAARVALAAYAEAVANPVLAQDLRSWLEGMRREEAEALGSAGDAGPKAHDGEAR